jgi:RNA polymerase sigma-70 factor (ECF subfamily)
MGLTDEATRAFARARGRWPKIMLPAEPFAAAVSALGLSPEALEEHGDDLFLATACVAGDPEGLRVFETEYLSQLGSVIQRFRLSPHLADELRQKVRVKLFVGQSPGIRGYAGRGPLGAFVRVTAARVAVDLAATSNGAVGREGADVLASSLTDNNDPELATIKLRYGDRLQEALEACFSALEPSDKTLLRLHLVDRLGVDALAPIFQTHRATVARRLVRLRAKLFDDLRERFALGLGASPSEVRSLVRVLASDVHLTASRVLKSNG